MKHIFNKVIMSVVALMIVSSVWAQDIIVTTNSQKIEAKILEVSKSEIKYKEMDNPDGPTFLLSTDEISSIIYANGKVVLYNQSANSAPQSEVQAVQTTTNNVPQAPIIDNKTVEILLLSGITFTAQITDMQSNYIAYILNGKPYTMPASQIQQVTFLQNGQVKVYGGMASVSTETNNTQNTSSSIVKSEKSVGGRIYRDNGHYLYNETYISSKEVERILQLENSTAYKEWQKANGMLIGGAVCAGIGGGLVLGGLFPLINSNYKACLGMECSALVPLTVGLGLTLGSSSHYNKAIDIYNSKYDHAAVQLRWSTTPNGVGLAIAF